VTATVDTADFDYRLPPELIAQEPAEPRDAARLLVAPGASAAVHAQVRDLPRWLRRGDLLVLNHTRVIPARLFAHKNTGGALEILLLHAEELAERPWPAPETAPAPGSEPAPGSALPAGERWRANAGGR
jgi:S-adenosylmethionine:tRNA-ribosyltransferase-isomerase (queuine synthetase)